MAHSLPLRFEIRRSFCNGVLGVIQKKHKISVYLIVFFSDNKAAIETVSEMVRRIPGCRPLDSGELSNATAIEAFTAVLLQLNVRYKTRVAPKLNGIKGDPRA